MGPVWVDMFYTWQADGKLPPNIKLEADRAGHAGPADVLRRCRRRRRTRELAEEFIALATSPKVQAEGIVKQLQLVSGHRRQARAGASSTRRRGRSCSPTSRRRISSSKGQPFPIAPYFNDILESLREEGRERVIATAASVPGWQAAGPSDRLACSTHRRASPRPAAARRARRLRWCTALFRRMPLGYSVVSAFTTPDGGVRLRQFRQGASSSTPATSSSRSSSSSPRRR